MNQTVSKQGRASWNTDFMEFAQIYLDDLPEMGTYWLQKFRGKLRDHISTTLTLKALAVGVPASPPPPPPVRFLADNF